MTKAHKTTKSKNTIIKVNSVYINKYYFTSNTKITLITTQKSVCPAVF